MNQANTVKDKVNSSSYLLFRCPRCPTHELESLKRQHFEGLLKSLLKHHRSVEPYTLFLNSVED